MEDIECGALNMFIVAMLEESDTFGFGNIRNIHDNPYYKELALVLGSEDFLLDISNCRVQSTNGEGKVRIVSLVEELSFDGQTVTYRINPSLTVNITTIKQLFEVS